MKINNLVLENIASYKKKIHIDFDQLHQDTNLTALTGDTGSGKSTILNAIAIALYGRTHKSINQEDIISLGKPTGYIELEFTTCKKYKSIWSARTLKKNGEPLKKSEIIRRLYTKENQEWVPINERIEDILELDFDQFTKTVVLNQGEFSKFLLSSFSERKQIIEKMFHDPNLEGINKNLKQKIKYLSEQIKENEIKLESLEITTDFNIEDKKIEITKISQEIDKLVNDQRYSKKKEHEIVEIKSTLNNLKSLKERKEKATTEHKTNDNTLIEYEQNINTFFDKTSEQIKNCEKEVIRIEKIIGLIEQKKIISSQILKITQNKNDTNDKIKKQNIEQEKNNRIIEEINNNISAQGITSTKEIEKQILATEHKKEIISFIETKKQKETHIDETLKSLQDEEKKLHTKENKLEDEIKISKEQIILLENKTIDKIDEVIARYENDKRILLSKIEKIKQVDKRLLEVEQELTAELKKKKILELEEEQIKKEEQLTKLNTAIEACIKESIRLNKCILCDNEKPKYNTTISNKISNSNRSEEIEKSKTQNADILIDLKSRKNTGLGMQRDLSSEINILKKNIDIIEEQHHNLEEIKTEQKEISENIIRTRTQIKSNTVLVAEISRERKLTSTKRQECATTLQKIVCEIKELEKKLNQLKEFNVENLQKLLKTKDSLVQKENIIKINNNIKANTLIAQKELENFEVQIKELQSDNIKILITEKDSKIDSKYQEHKRSELVALKDDFKQKETEYNELKIKHAQSKSKLSNTIFQEEETTNLVTNLINSFNKDSSVHLDKEVDLEIVNSIKNNFAEQIAKTDEKLDIYKDKRRTIEIQVQDYEQKIGKQNDLLIIHKALKKQSNQYENLNGVIGGDSFRNFILGQIEKNLLIYTNKELERLCDNRYELVQVSSGKKKFSEYYIIDKFQGGSQRKVNTLSGGETFMVSLAMAFGLSNLSRGFIDIESFFIDEGFGTLDQDSLNDVFNVLENIQNENKRVCLITHVKELAQRIHVNLNVIKDPRDTSDVQIIYN